MLMRYLLRETSLLAVVLQALLLVTIPAKAAVPPLATMASITGEILVGNFWLEGDSADNSLTIQYLPVSGNGEGYILTTDPADTITITETSGLATLIGNGTNSVFVAIANGDLDFIEFRGRQGNDTLTLLPLNDPLEAIGGDGNDTFTVAVSGHITLEGNGGDDTFQLLSNVVISGSVTGHSGSDTLAVQGSGTSVTMTTANFDGYSGTVGHISGGFSGIDSISAPGSDSVLQGRNANALWRVNANPEYTADFLVMNFSGFEELRGGSMDDEFRITGAMTANVFGNGGDDILQINNGGSLTGMFDGGSQDLEDHVINGNPGAAAVLTGSAANGFSGTFSNLSGGFINANAVSGTGAGATLQGQPVPSTWNISFAGANYDNGTHDLRATSFDEYIGNNASDDFTVHNDATANLSGRAGTDSLTIPNGATLTGSFDGQGGDDTLTIGSNNHAVTLASSGGLGYSGTTPSLSGGFSGVNIINGTGNNQQLVGANSVTADPALWSLDLTTFFSDNANTLYFSGFATLSGNTGSDRFIVQTSISTNLNGNDGDDEFILVGNVLLSGQVNGHAGYDSLLLDQNGSAISSGYADADGFDGSVGGVTFFSGIDFVSASGTGDSLHVFYGNDQNAAPGSVAGASCQWTISNSSFVVRDEVLDFSGFEQLIGCALNNLFQVSPPLNVASLDINGGFSDDQLVLYFGGGNLNADLTFHGNGQTTAPGDSMQFFDANPDTAEYLYGVVDGGDAINGIVNLTGSSPVTFTGLESPTFTASANHVIFDLGAVPGDVTYGPGGESSFSLQVGGVQYHRAVSPLDTLTLKPFTGGASTWQIGNLGSAFVADLHLLENAGDTTLEWTGVSTLGTNASITAAANYIDVQGEVNLSGSGAISLESQGDIDLTTANAALTTSGGTINLLADRSQTFGEFSSAAGSEIDSGTGDILVQAEDMSFNGTLSGGYVELQASQPLGGFILGPIPSVPTSPDQPMGSGPTIYLNSTYRANIFASDSLEIGGPDHSFIWIDETADFTGQTGSVHFKTNPSQTIRDVGSPSPTLVAANSTFTGTLRPDSSSVGIFEVTGRFILDGSATLEIEISGSTPGNNPDGLDQLLVNGEVSLNNGASLQVYLRDGYVPPVDQQFVIIENDGADAVSGTFAGLPEGATLNVGIAEFTISYLGLDGATGNDVVLTAAPSDVIFKGGFEE